MVNLTLTEKGGTTNELSFDKFEVTVGRVRGNDIVLPKGNVSKHHCRLLSRDGEIVVEDLHSTNGTYVNGRKIGEPTPLAPGDKVFVGDFIMRIAALEAARGSAVPSHPEAGSLSSAIPRRAPPPHRPSVDEGMGSAPKAPPSLSGRQPMPPPPPLPGKRDSAGMAALSEPLPSPLSGPSDINLDDEDDDGAPHPQIKIPPLKPAVQPAERMSELETPAGGLSTPHPMRERPPVDDDLAPPAPASVSSDAAPDLGEDDDDDMFALARAQSRPTRAAEPPRAPEPPKAHDVPRPSEPAKSKAPPAVAPGKAASRITDRDLPDWLVQLLDGEGVTAAFFSGPNQAEVQRAGRRENVNVSASDLAGLGAVVRKLALKGSPKPAPEAAAINTTLPDGMHVAAIFPPIADRLCVAIRRPVAIGKTVEDLVDDHVISTEMRQVLDACVATRRNLLISGDRAACDSLLRAVLWSVDRVARVALISSSITPPSSASSWLRFHADAAAADLVAAAVAMQPEYLVVDAGQPGLLGEVLAECSLGLSGAIVALIGRSSGEALHRLQGLASAHGAAGAADLVASSIDVIVQTSVLADGTLKVVEISEPKASLEGQVSSHALLTWISGEGGGGSFTVTGAQSTLASKLARAGSPLPADILTRAS
jgi:pilus assembly protein CpaF